LVLGAEIDAKYRRKWFSGGETVDNEIKSNFTEDLEWLTNTNDTPNDPYDCLARVIVLDQFSRNVHRETAGMFATDAQALMLARFAIKEGYHMKIKHPFMRVFLYMPYMHVEDMTAQDEGLNLFQETWDAEPEGSSYKTELTRYVQSMKYHRGIILQFGRFPHRNVLLGRETTKEESDFLAAGGGTFGVRQNKKN